jgi:hypothetical protein
VAPTARTAAHRARLRPERVTSASSAISCPTVLAKSEVWERLTLIFVLHWKLARPPRSSCKITSSRPDPVSHWMETGTRSWASPKRAPTGMRATICAAPQVATAAWNDMPASVARPPARAEASLMAARSELLCVHRCFRPTKIPRT